MTEQEKKDLRETIREGVVDGLVAFLRLAAMATALVWVLGRLIGLIW
jgi:hypothetical protein